MAYIVLARKWRPQRFGDVIGQEHVIRTLQNALEQQRLGHAFIFAGPRGVGKTTTARLLARAANGELLSESVDGATLEKQSLDIIEIDGASNRGIDEIRNLRDNIRFAPTSSTYKVYIIDEVHMLSKEAFNALLKTLEEPPAHAIFIFATTEIHRVPLTILSRCQRFDFKRIPTRLIADQLAAISQKEGIEIDQDSLLTIARKADGGMRDATSLLDQIISFTGTTITIEDVRSSLGLISEELYFEFTSLLPEKDDARLIAYADRVFQHGYDLIHFLRGLQEHIRRLMITAATGSAKQLEMSDHYQQKYLTEAAKFESADLLHYLDLITRHEQQLKFSENPHLILELLLLKLSHKPLAVDLETLLKLLKSSGGSAPSSPDKPAPSGGNPPSPPAPEPPAPPSPQAGSEQARPAAAKPEAPKPSGKDAQDRFSSLGSLKLPGKSVPPQAAARPAPEAHHTEPDSSNSEHSAPVSSLTAEQIKNDWPALIDLTRKGSVILASCLQDGVPYQIEHNVLQVAFDPRTGFHMEHAQKNRAAFEKIISDHYRESLRIDCIQLSFKEKGIERQIETPEESFQKMKDQEPVLKKIIELFDCEDPDL